MELKTVKTIVGYTKLAQFLHALKNAHVGYVRRLPVHTPYSWSSTHDVYIYDDLLIIIAETKHRTYSVIRVPKEYRIYQTNEEAENEFVLKQALHGEA